MVKYGFVIIFLVIKEIDSQPQYLKNPCYIYGYRLLW